MTDFETVLIVLAPMRAGDTRDFGPEGHPCDVRVRAEGQIGKELHYRVYVQGRFRAVCENTTLAARLVAKKLTEVAAMREPKPVDPSANEPGWMRNASDRKAAVRARRVKIEEKWGLTRYDPSDANLRDPGWRDFAIEYDAVSEVYTRSCSDEKAIRITRAHWERAQGKPGPEASALPSKP